MVDLLQERWLTYAELGQLLGASPAAARAYANRRGWARRTPNAYGERARVLVPAETPIQPRTASYPVHTPSAGAHDPMTANGYAPMSTGASEQVFELLREQLTIVNAHLEHERKRVERAERLFEEERERVRELQTALADAVAAERISADTAAAVRHELDLLTERRPWWRRWFR